MTSEGLKTKDSRLKFRRNMVAFREAEEEGKFKDLEPGTWVAFHEKELVGSDLDKKKLKQELYDGGKQGCLITQVGVPKNTVRMRSPRRTL